MYPRGRQTPIHFSFLLCQGGRQKLFKVETKHQVLQGAATTCSSKLSRSHGGPDASSCTVWRSLVKFHTLILATQDFKIKIQECVSGHTEGV